MRVSPEAICSSERAALASAWRSGSGPSARSRLGSHASGRATARAGGTRRSTPCASRAHRAVWSTRPAGRQPSSRWRSGRPCRASPLQGAAARHTQARSSAGLGLAVHEAPATRVPVHHQRGFHLPLRRALERARVARAAVRAHVRRGFHVRVRVAHVGVQASAGAAVLVATARVADIPAAVVALL
eukprot:scaffold89837_cov63-Phaeocystis_antarctica.AAC.1